MQLMSSMCLFRLFCSCKCPSLNTENCGDSSHRPRTQSTVPAITSCILLYYTKFTLIASLTLLAPTNLTTLSGKQRNHNAGHEAFSNPKSVIHYNTVSQLPCCCHDVCAHSSPPAPGLHTVVVGEESEIVSSAVDITNDKINIMIDVFPHMSLNSCEIQCSTRRDKNCHILAFCEFSHAMSYAHIKHIATILNLCQLISLPSHDVT